MDLGAYARQLIAEGTPPQYAYRVDGRPKQRGFLGEIRLPDGQGVMTENSVNIDGREMPSIIPGMHPADLNYMRETLKVPEDMRNSIANHAMMRLRQGKSTFYEPGD